MLVQSRFDRLKVKLIYFLFLQDVVYTNISFIEKVKLYFQIRFSSKYKMYRDEVKFYASTGDATKLKHPYNNERWLYAEFCSLARPRKVRKARSYSKQEYGLDDFGYDACKEISGVETIERIIKLF